MSYEDWPAPPAYDVVAPKAAWPKLGTVALSLILAGPILMVLGFALTIALGALFPLPLYLAAFLTLLLVPSGLVVAVVGVWRNSRRWRAVAAVVVAAPATALALSFSLPAMEFLTSR